MAQKAFNIYTPSADAPHIYAEDEAQLNRARLDPISGIAEADDLLACTRVNDNTVRLAAGVYSNQGFIILVPKDGDGHEDLAVESGSAGLYRRDLVVADFTRGGGAVEDVHVFTVVKGTPAASDAGAVLPTLTQDDLTTGGARRQEALYSVLINGTTLSTITRIAATIGFIKERADAAAALAAGLAPKQDKMTLMWTNPDPSVDFAPQTVALALTGYDYVRVIYAQQKSVLGNVADSGIIPIGKGAMLRVADQTSGYEYRRSIVTVSTSGVQFATSIVAPTYSSYVIPLYIYAGNF